MAKLPKKEQYEKKLKQFSKNQVKALNEAYKFFKKLTPNITRKGNSDYKDFLELVNKNKYVLQRLYFFSGTDINNPRKIFGASSGKSLEIHLTPRGYRIVTVSKNESTEIFHPKYLKKYSYYKMESDKTPAFLAKQRALEEGSRVGYSKLRTWNNL